MTEADEKRFATLLRAMGETFGAPITSGQILGYRMALGDLPIEAIEKAVKTALGACKFMPKPAELRELAGGMTAETRAVIAWGAVKKAVHAVSIYGSVDFDDPVVNATVRNLGGWVSLCNSDAAEFDTWIRKRFEDVYVRLYKLDLHPDQTRHLPGLHGERPKGLFVTGLPVPPRPKELATSAKPGALRAMPEGPASMKDVVASWMKAQEES